MSDAFLDTTFLIDLYRRDPGAVRVWNRLFAGEITVAFSPLTVLEIWLGNFAADEERFYEDALSLAEEVPLNSEAAKAAARMLKPIRPVPERLVRDALIAASASQRDEVVMTRNRRDFERFTSRIDSYTE